MNVLTIQNLSKRFGKQKIIDHVCNEPVCFGQTQTNQYIGYLPDVP